eukprot:6174724-Pleurochrysis_carterae.AAC.2
MDLGVGAIPRHFGQALPKKTTANDSPINVPKNKQLRRETIGFRYACQKCISQLPHTETQAWYSRQVPTAHTQRGKGHRTYIGHPRFSCARVSPACGEAARPLRAARAPAASPGRHAVPAVSR